MSTAKPSLAVVETHDRLRRVEAAARGERAAAAELATELLPRIRNLIRYLTRNDADTDDITHDAMLTVLRSLSTYRGEGIFESWVDRVVARATFTALRRRRFERSFAVLDGTSASDGVGGIQTDEFLTRRDAIRVLDELPIEQRHVLVLHHVLEMSVPEVADELSIPFETVRSRLRLARNRLRALGFAMPPDNPVGNSVGKRTRDVEEAP